MFLLPCYVIFLVVSPVSCIIIMMNVISTVNAFYYNVGLYCLFSTGLSTLGNGRAPLGLGLAFLCVEVQVIR